VTETLRRAQPWLGTLVSIEAIVDRARPGTHAAMANAFASIARVHAAMASQCAGSDVARFNAAAHGAVVTCDPWTIRLLRIAAQLRLASAGLFDVALGSTRGAGYRIVDARHVLKLDEAARIDLGGIAKGFAVDRAVAILRRHRVLGALVNAGGDLRGFGPGAWPVRVRGSRLRLTVKQGAIATSHYRNGRSLYRDDPLVAPDRREVHAVDRLVTVAAPRCVFADALTKVVALTGDPAHPLLLSIGAQAWLQ